MPRKKLPLDPGSAEPFTDAQRILRLAKLVKPTEKPEKWFVNIQGGCTRFRKTGGRRVEPPDRKDSQIGHFSSASRLRLLSYMNKIDWNPNPSPVFVTLTYPDSILHRDYSRRSVDRFLFLRYIEKHRNVKTPSIWRVEWKPRKSGEFVGRLMPHWHLLLPSVTALNENVVRELWRKSIGHDGTYLDVDVRAVVGPEAAVKYLAKYVSKGLSLGINAYRNSGFRFGRHWGVTRKAMIPLQPVILSRQLSEDEVIAVKQYATTVWANYDFEEGAGYTLLSPKLASEWTEFLN